MNSSRFIAFYDAVLAIIMTIIVLSFDLPNQASWDALRSLIPGFICYAGSFFWLGLMWISSYIAWQKVTRISPRSLFFMLVSLFCCSFFPFATALVGEDVYSLPAQLFYGLVVLCITVANVALTRAINRDHCHPVLGTLFVMPSRDVWLDLAIKIAGLLITLFVWTPAMSLSILIAVITISVRLFLNARKISATNCNEQDGTKAKKIRA